MLGWWLRHQHLVERGHRVQGSSLSFKSHSRPGVLKAVAGGLVAVLAVTAQRALYLYDLEVKCWEQLLEDMRFQSTASWRQPLVPRASDCVPGQRGRGASGCPHQHSDCSCGPDPVPREGAQPELGLEEAMRELLLLASGPGGVVACLEVSANAFLARPSSSRNVAATSCLQASRWHTCSAFLPPGDFLVCGDRRGSVLLYLPTRAAQGSWGGEPRLGQCLSLGAGSGEGALLG